MMNAVFKDRLLKFVYRTLNGRFEERRTTSNFYQFFLPNLAGKLTWCLGHVIWISALNLAGKLYYFLGHVTSISTLKLEEQFAVGNFFFFCLDYKLPYWKLLYNQKNIAIILRIPSNAEARATRRFRPYRKCRWFVSPSCPSGLSKLK